jgi:hypothetical protein
MVVAAVGALIVVAVAVTLVVVTARSHQPTPIALPLRTTGELALPGNSSRFDYASLDTGRGLLFIAHLGASEIIEVDIHTHHVMRTILNLPQVHGVLVVPALHRVYATATGTNLMVSLDEDTGAVPTRTPSGEYPDGLAYDPRRAAIWTTNETSGSETVIDAVTGAVRGTVALGAEAGNDPLNPGRRSGLNSIGFELDLLWTVGTREEHRGNATQRTLDRLGFGEVALGQCNPCSERRLGGGGVANECTNVGAAADQLLDELATHGPRCSDHQDHAGSRRRATIIDLTAGWVRRERRAAAHEDHAPTTAASSLRRHS